MLKKNDYEDFLLLLNIFVSYCALPCYNSNTSMLLLLLYVAVKRKSSEDKVPILHIYFAKKCLCHWQYNKWRNGFLGRLYLPETHRESLRPLCSLCSRTPGSPHCTHNYSLTSEKVREALVHKRGRNTNMTDCILSL